MKKIISLILAIIMMMSTVIAVTATENDDPALQEDTVLSADGSDESIGTQPEQYSPAITTGEADVAPVEDGVDAIPTVTAITTCDGGLKVSWKGTSQAVKYRLFLQKETGGWKKVGDTEGLSLNHTGLVSGTAYTYTVRALDADNGFLGGYDPEGMTATYYSAPELTSVTSVYGGQRVAWKAVDGIVYYRVFVKNGSNWRALATVTDTAFTNADVVSGTAYTYTVRAVGEDGTTALSYYDKKGVTGTYVAAPAITSVSPADGGLKVSWKASAGAAKYRLFSKKDTGGWKKIADTASTSYIHTGLTSLTDYCYTVRALDKNGNFISGFDNDGDTSRYVGAPVLSVATNRFGYQRVSWSSAGVGLRYRAYVRSGSSWKSLGTTVSTYFDNADVESGMIYNYTVRVVSNDGKENRSYYDKKGVSALYVAAPTVTGFTPVKGGMKVKWSPERGTVMYRLFVKKETGGWKKVGDTEGLSMNYTGLTDGTAYTFTVRALNAKGEYLSDYDPAGTTFTYLESPQFNDIGYANSNYQLSWSADARIAQFRVYHRTFGSSWESVGDFAGTSCTDADPDLPVQHTIRGLDADGNVITYYVDNGPYYYHGSLANGSIKVGSTSIYFLNGRVKQGYIKSGGKTYYYNSKGVLLKNTIVGSKSEGYTYADKNGVCCTSEEIELAATFMMKYCKGDTLQEKMKYGFMYLAKHFPYRRSYDHPSKAEDIPALAIDMFKKESGNCFRYAACFTCIAKIAGYRTRMVIGTTGGNPHGWTEVLVDGQWLICDVDANLPGYGNADYAAYMMKTHFWQLTAKTKCELTIDSSGKAVWK